MAASDDETAELLLRLEEEGPLTELEAEPERCRPWATRTLAAPLPPRSSGRSWSLPLTLLVAAVLAITASSLLPDSVGRAESTKSSAALIGRDEVFPRPPVRKFGPRRHLARGRLPHRRPRVARARPPQGVPGWVAEAVGLVEASERCRLPQSEAEDWDELSSLELAGAEALGWTKEMWSCDGAECASPPSSETDWADLSEAARSGARALGWTRLTWQLPGSEGEFWDGLSMEERKGAEALGYTEDIWNCKRDDCSEPPSDSLRWGELSEAELSGARALGWTRTLWNEC